MLGLALIVGGAGLLWSMQHYRQQANANSQTLLHQIPLTPNTAPNPGTQLTAATPALPAACTAPPVSTVQGRGPRAVLNIAALGLTVPILAGTDDVTLDSGVGHLDTSNWPDQGGTAVLEAHNVTFFAHLPQLTPGDQITVSAPCHTWTYEVTDGAVVEAGSPVANNAAPTLVLVTCSPADALFLTNQRYVLTANLVRATASDVPPSASLPPTPTVQAVHAALPSVLSPAELSVDSVGIPLGRLRLTDPLDPFGAKSAGGFQAAQQVTALLVAAERAATEGRRDWWATIAPTVPYAQAAIFSGPAHWRGQVNLSITANDGTITGANVTGTVGSGVQPTAVSMTFVVTNSMMTIDKATGS